MAAVGYIIFYFWTIPAFRCIWSVGPDCLSELPCFYSQNMVCHRTYLCDMFTWEVLLPSLQQTTFEIQICDWNIFCRIFDHCRDMIVIAGGNANTVRLSLFKVGIFKRRRICAITQNCAEGFRGFRSRVRLLTDTRQGQAGIRLPKRSASLPRLTSTSVETGGISEFRTLDLHI